MTKNFIFFIITCVVNLYGMVAKSQEAYHEQYRPQVHFSPREHWVNDPNGMVYYKGIYHLFFQYYPDATVWGPMHWGHATSKDLVHWQQQATALYPDSLGYIFSGSAVVDYHNTSGFGKKGKAPLVAIFTHHDPKAEKAKRNDFQNQSIAYSLDEGKTWTKYAGNPVLKNPGITDFRDPKVMWYEAGKKWVMTLATKDRVTFYSSPNLKDWQKESEFGEKLGAHGGVWECPDLFPLEYDGKQVWVLIANIGNGAPNGGSGTQYFLGDFDGHAFTPNSTQTKWLDYGPDDYAGITWGNTGNRKIFIGWMSNWQYANQVPTVKWRNAMTVPRELKLKQVGGEMFVSSLPVNEIHSIQGKPMVAQQLVVDGNYNLFAKTDKTTTPCRIDIDLDKVMDFSIVLSNSGDEKLVIGFDKQNNTYFIDRTNSGKVDFKNGFAAKHSAPRLSEGAASNISIILDESSAELFADDGLTVMTEIFFPQKPFDKVQIQARGKEIFKKIKFATLKSIWP